MATNPPSPSTVIFPSEMVNAIKADALRDADRVGQYLRSLGLSGSRDKPLWLPERFLYFLGAALRLLDWETKGFFHHAEAGLPKASEAIDAAIQSLEDPNADPTELCVRVMRLSVERFAWNGPAELGVDVSLGEAEEDLLLEALADYLWANRPR
jgi:hypothetical protein